MSVVTTRPLPPPIDKYETPMERIFNNGVIGGPGVPASLPKGDDDSVYQYIVRAMIDDAESFEDSTLAPDREENLKYFYGELPEEDDGSSNSKAVSTDFRDTVMAIIP